MSRSAKLFLASWCLGVMLVSVVSSESTRTICHVDICTSEEFCDHGERHCRPCDNIRGDCLEDSLPLDCRSWCIVADCPDLGPLEHGNYINVSNYRHGTTVTFTCDEGYRLVGMNTSTCGDFKTTLCPCVKVKVFVSAGWRDAAIIQVSFIVIFLIILILKYVSADWQNATIVQAHFIVIPLILQILMVCYIVCLRMRHTPKEEESAANGAVFNADKNAVISVVEQKGTDIRSSSLKSNSSADSGVESSRESRTVSEERGDDTGRVLNTEHDTLSGRDTHVPLRRGAASEPNIDHDGGIRSAPSMQRAESEPNMESNAPTKSCHTGESFTGERPTGERPSPTGERPEGECPTGERPTGECPTGERHNGDEGQFTYIDYSTNVKSVAIHMNSNTLNANETYNYKSGERNSSRMAYKSNNNRNNTNYKNDAGPRSDSKPETVAAQNDACSFTGRNSPHTGSVDLSHAAKKQVPADDIKFGTPESNQTECRQPEEQGGTFQVITSVEDSYHGICSPSELNVRLSDANAALGDNATDPDHSKSSPWL